MGLVLPHEGVRRRSPEPGDVVTVRGSGLGTHIVVSVRDFYLRGTTEVKVEPGEERIDTACRAAGLVAREWGYSTWAWPRCSRVYCARCRALIPFLKAIRHPATRGEHGW